MLPAQATLNRTYPAAPAISSSCVLTLQPAKSALACAVPANQAQGAYQVIVTQADAVGSSREGTSSTVNVVQTANYNPHVTGPNLPIGPGKTDSIKGTGFIPGGTVSLSTNSPLLPGGAATVDANGNFDFALTPKRFAPEGPYIVNVIDDTTGVSAQLQVYVLQAHASLSASVNSGVVGGYTTTINGAGFASGSYTLDLALYSSDGTTVVAELAHGVAVNDGALASTSVTIPDTTPAGMYQVAAISGQAQVAATWIAVFPKPTVITPETPVLPVITPVIPIVPVAPLPSDPAGQASAPAPVPLIHRVIAAPTTDPFMQVLKDKVPDLNSSTPHAAKDGFLSQDPTLEAIEQDQGSQVTPSPQDGATVVDSSHASETSDFPWWLLILVAIIAAGLGLGGGYGIASNSRRRR